ncbi:MAG: zinc ribbon domain-containing protein [Smithellaceae bacterium]|jgi:putative FmdB family regulatory protein|nr:zinc ribbon domain-containing protein [Smithellaceae bacterium]
MPTYEYACSHCGLHFEKRQSMNDEPVSGCPECGGEVQRLISGGTGFMMKGSAGRGRTSGECLLATTGRTCCGTAGRCSDSVCGE